MSTKTTTGTTPTKKTEKPEKAISLSTGTKPERKFSWRVVSDPPAPKKIVNLVITDLDDTIWDWFAMWHKSFEPYITRMSKECGIDIETLKKDFRRLHTRYHTSECSYIYKEIPSLTPVHHSIITDESNGSVSILHEYYKNKRANLRLYDGVYNTLIFLKSKGVRVVGFTESQIFYTKYRLKHLGLDGLFDSIYTIEDHALPETVTKVYNETAWDLSETELKVLARNTLKPNAKILKEIVSQQNGSISNCIYIGDKLDRDVFMAQKAGVYSVYAKYGHGSSSIEYELLKSVSHWTDSDIKREIDFRAAFSASAVKPDLTLRNSLSEIIDKFDFTPFAELKQENKEVAQKIWEKTIDVQQHFNDIELRIRNFALTAFTFILTGMGFLYKENSAVSLFGFSFQSAAFLGLIGANVIILFFLWTKLGTIGY